MYGLERQVAERTQRLLDMAEDIRMERFLRDGPPDEVEVSIAMPSRVADEPAVTAPALEACGSTKRSSHPRAA
jgi:hypothetical protein